MSKSLLTRHVILRRAKINARPLLTAYNGDHIAPRNRTTSVHSGLRQDLEKPQGTSLPQSVSVFLRRSDERTLDQLVQSLKYKFSTSNAAGSKSLGATGSDCGLIILATPKFVRWLRDDEKFMPKVLESVLFARERLSYPFEIDVLCACVDGISPPADQISKEPEDIEGFSFLLGDRSQILPEIWNKQEQSDSVGDGQSSLRFSGRGSSISNITVPLANTLFQTGTVSYLQGSRWIRTAEQKLTKVSSRTMCRQNVNVLDDSESNNISTYIPAIPLTPARPIVNGLGNIIRRIDFGLDGEGPASLELEKRVDQYRAYLSKISKSSSSLTFAVWALVVPETAAKNDTRTSQFTLQLSNDGVDDKAFGKIYHEYVNHWINKGAIFCRVLSGGGGWGAKQGLLSLDPQTSFDAIEQQEPQLDFMYGDINQQQLSGLGNIARPSAYIQFFVTKLGNPNQDFQQPPDVSKTLQRVVVIGTIPSTMDDMPSDDNDAPDQPYIKVEQGHFGCVSQFGIYIDNKSPPSTAGGTAPIKTKIDLPHSYVYKLTD